ncbi:MAG: acetate/propionate family kinase [Rhodobacteraceae bacterium]|nr:acetate/propionate family kinase [Paracoccaceae bacterium]
MKHHAILTLNAGSSSLKYALYDTGAERALIAKGLIDRIGQAPEHHDENGTTALPRDGGIDHQAALAWLTASIRRRFPALDVIAAGHRVVHGGQDFTKATRITPQVLKKIQALTPLALGHQPHNLAGIDAISAVWPDLPQVACFDTAFHRTQPRLAELFAIPRALSDEGVLRYGFHGLSYDYIASRLPDFLSKQERRRVIVLHLGHGASLCAMHNGQSVATSMGFTALDGLMMGKRCGAIDPGVILYLLRDKGLSLTETEALLSSQSGLLGVSGGISSDMRDLTESNNPHAQEAIDLFVYRCISEIGAKAAVLGGLDAIVFTAGIGEHAAQVRQSILEGCAWLGVTIGRPANAANETLLSTKESKVKALVIPTDEEKTIAEQSLALLGV